MTTYHDYEGGPDLSNPADLAEYEDFYGLNAYDNEDAEYAWTDEDERTHPLLGEVRRAETWGHVRDEEYAPDAHLDMYMEDRLGGGSDMDVEF